MLNAVVCRRRQRVVNTIISGFRSVRKQVQARTFAERAGCLKAFGEGLRCYPLW